MSSKNREKKELKALQQVEPALFNSSHRKFKLSTQQMQHFFFMQHQSVATA